MGAETVEATSWPTTERRLINGRQSIIRKIENHHEAGRIVFLLCCFCSPASGAPSLAAWNKWSGCGGCGGAQRGQHEKANEKIQANHFV